MSTCREITGLVTAHLEGGLDPRARAEVEGHLAGCEACRAYLAQVAATARALSALPPEPLPAALEARLMAGFAARRWRVPRRAALAAAAAALATAGLLAGAGHHPSRAPADWLVASIMAGLAVGLAAALRRLTPAFALASVGAALGAALLGEAGAPLGAAHGLDCLLTVGASAAVVGFFAWLPVHREGTARVALAAGAIAGALAGDAALELTCAAHGAIGHQLLFHFGGVAAVAAGAWAIARRRTAARAAA